MTSSEEGEGEDDSAKAMCANPEGSIGCLATKSECSTMMDMMAQSMPGADKGNILGYFGVYCDYTAKDCEKKSEAPCEGKEEAQKSFGEKKCDSGGDPSQCCSEVETMATCQGKDCMKLSFAMAGMASKTDPGAAKTMEVMLAISKACPDVGMPTSEAEVE